MLKWLIIIIINIFSSLVVSASASDCNSASATNRLECSKFDVDDNNRCCLFTSGVEQVHSCYVVDMSTIATMNTSVKAFKDKLSDQENITFDCGTKIEQCLQVKSPYLKSSCNKVEVEFNQTCCLLNIDDAHSCYPVKADSLEAIETFAEEYETEYKLNSTPSVICISERLQFALISLFIIALTLF